VSAVPTAWALFPVSALVSLAASALLVVRLERVAARLGLREATLGLIAALAADGPEITSAVTGMLRGQRAVGIGVVLGSNVFNLAALLGLGALVAGRIRLHRDVVVFAGAVAGAIALVSIGAAAGAVPAPIALALAGTVFVPYVVVSSMHPARLERGPMGSKLGVRLARAVLDEEEELAQAIRPSRGRPVDVAVAVVALVAVIGSSVVLEHSATTIGDRYQISGILVGGVVLAAVTSLPNAVAAIYLASRGRGSAVLSEALNSNSLNVLFGLLVPAVFVGLGRYGAAGQLVALWYGSMTIAALVLAYRGRGIGRPSGALLVCGYFGLVATLVLR
jgi:cation:H+ antiporter